MRARGLRSSGPVVQLEDTPRSERGLWGCESLRDHFDSPALRASSLSAGTSLLAGAERARSASRRAQCPPRRSGRARPPGVAGRHMPAARSGICPRLAKTRRREARVDTPGYFNRRMPCPHRGDGGATPSPGTLFAAVAESRRRTRLRAWRPSKGHRGANPLSRTSQVLFAIFASSRPGIFGIFAASRPRPRGVADASRGPNARGKVRLLPRVSGAKQACPAKRHTRCAKQGPLVQE